MSETQKPNEMLKEQNITSTPEEAVNATTPDSTAETDTEQPMDETVENTSTAESTDDTNIGLRPATRTEIIERLQEIADSDDALNCKPETDGLKILFYKLRTAEIDAERKAFVADGGEENVFIPEPDILEEPFKAAMQKIKDKRNEWFQAQEAEMQANYEIKSALLDELKQLVDKAEQGTPEVNEFRNIQNRWKDIKKVPQDKVNHLWKQYQQYTEQFYDVLKLNHEFREYDFKKNLEAKKHLCEAAEALMEQADVVSAFRQLQQLHNDFRETGPVAPELREEIWTRFKNASTVINRRHQEHFENKKERERENLARKTAICEEIEAIEYAKLTSYQSWNNMTEKVLAMQSRWKEIGFAPQKMNLKIFERFRSSCDNFFNRKSEFFKNVKSTLAENLERKRALCEAAEALKDSEEWKETADKLTKLQKEWKEIGPVTQKYSEAVWKRFVSACDEFFERRNKATSSQRSVEQENLKLKRDIVARLATIDETATEEEQIKAVNTLTAEWNRTGHVPFKEKDKIHKEYKTAVNAIYERLHISANERKLADFRNNIAKGGNTLSRERDRLIRQYENLKAEISTYENNLGFLSTSNKKGESLVDVMRQKMEKLKADAQVMLQKIHMIEEEIEKQ